MVLFCAERASSLHDGRVDKGRPSQIERKRASDREQFERRASIVRLPMIPLEFQGFLVPPRDLQSPHWAQDASAYGVGPAGEELAVWREMQATGIRPVEGSRERLLITRHDAGSAPLRSIEIETVAIPRFVQPTPDGGTLLVTARSFDGRPSAEHWSGDGELLAQADFGDALEDVLMTPSGRVWVSYFDEAHRFPGIHRLVRFGRDLSTEWLYPFNPEWRGGSSPGLPPADDVYSLNVVGESAYMYTYSSFHIVTVNGEVAQDLGKAPLRGGKALLVDGTRAAIIGGYESEHDLITLLELTPDGPVVVGRQGRVVQPNGSDLHRARWICRGQTAHVLMSGHRLCVTLQSLFDQLS